MEKYGNGAKEGSSDLFISNQFEAFSYGGTTISSEEMMVMLKPHLDHFITFSPFCAMKTSIMTCNKGLCEKGFAFSEYSEYRHIVLCQASIWLVPIPPENFNSQSDQKILCYREGFPWFLVFLRSEFGGVIYSSISAVVACLPKIRHVHPDFFLHVCI